MNLALEYLQASKEGEGSVKSEKATLGTNSRDDTQITGPDLSSKSFAHVSDFVIPRRSIILARELTSSIHYFILASL